MTQDGKPIVFRGVRVFDSRAGRLGEPTSVVVRGSTIESVGVSDLPEPARVIEGGGRALLPGLIDVHWHSMFAAAPLADALTADPGYLELVAGKAATETLMRGFTSVRDAGGPVFGLKRAIDQGVLAAPGFFPPGAFISQSGGHGDFRPRHDVPRGRILRHGHSERIGATSI